MAVRGIREIFGGGCMWFEDLVKPSSKSGFRRYGHCFGLFCLMLSYGDLSRWYGSDCWKYANVVDDVKYVRRWDVYKQRLEMIYVVNNKCKESVS